MTGEGSGRRLLVRLVATLAGFFGGAVIGGLGIAPLMYTILNPSGSFGNEFEGLEHMLFFGVLGAIVGAVGLNMMVGRVQANGGRRARRVLAGTVGLLVGLLPGIGLGTYLYEHGGPGTILYPPDAPAKCRRPYVVTANCGGTMPYVADPSDRTRPIWALGGVVLVGGLASVSALGMERRFSRGEQKNVVDTAGG